MANAQLLYAHVCDQVFPSEGGKLNLIGIFGGQNNPGSIGVRQFPGIYPRIALAVGLSTSLTELPIEVAFKDEDDADVVPPFSGTFTIEKRPDGTETSNVNFNLNFEAFQITKPGKLRFLVTSGKEEVAEIEMNAIKPPEPAQGA